MNPTVDRAKLS